MSAYIVYLLLHNVAKLNLQTFLYNKSINDCCFS